jgi:hypothetical protein
MELHIKKRMMHFIWTTQCIIKATSVDILHPKFCQSFVEIICDFVFSTPCRVFLVKGKSFFFGAKYWELPQQKSQFIIFNDKLGTI